jgi:c-di-GMP-binding flagellar brake protein YcgR
MANTNNRRRHFRIDEVVELNYKVIDVKEAAVSSHITDNVLSASSLAAALEAVSKESARLLRRLERSQPETGQYLKLLEDKIDLLAQAVLMQAGRSVNKNTSEINLSASGLAFQSDEMLAAGAFLELKMLFVSFRVLIVTCGKVVDCKKNQSGDSRFPYRVSVDFVNMKEQDRELLIRHLVRRQSQQIREKKDSVET